MNSINIFDKKYLDLLAPNGVEYIWGVYMHLGIKDNESSKPNNKRIILDTIKSLLNYSILQVGEWYQRPELNSKKLTVKEIVKNLDEIWNEKATYPDFYDMVYFTTPEWYVNKTKKLGLTMTTDWKTFVKEEIGDLEKWIEENRPKNTNHNMV
ncbi:hypothetical protein [Croceivirga sp. JEA036]|uniref:hypothetical protein n=1 Tax=Croceivirga sp. JEA036 TaxID=2721162 RepID=UPI00143B3DFD|nr:hypothetical protein [Croceivirga sp. JEA036]NJB38200.1 hypothetical protein [Croceivirga sp. JEA036]